MTTLVVLQAGMSTPSTTQMVADRLASAVVERNPLIEVKIISIVDLVGDVATMFSTGVHTRALSEALSAVAAADAVIAATPTFSASYAGHFKMFIDALDKKALIDTPVVLVATAGTARHSLVIDHALRPLFSFLRARIMPTGVFVATDDFGLETDLDARITRAADELVDAMATAQKKTDTELDFASLLSGHEGLQSLG